MVNSNVLMCSVSFDVYSRFKLHPVKKHMLSRIQCTPLHSVHTPHYCFLVSNLQSATPTPTLHVTSGNIHIVHTSHTIPPSFLARTSRLFAVTSICLSLAPSSIRISCVPPLTHSWQLLHRTESQLLWKGIRTWRS